MNCVTLTLNPSLDISTAVTSVSGNRKLRCDEPLYEPGGGGINVSAAMQELGAESRAMYLCGGPPGQTLRQLIEERGLGQIPVGIDGWTRNNLAVTEHSSQDQYRFVLPGPGVEEAEIDACFDTLQALRPIPDYVVASGSLPRGVPPEKMAELAQIVQGMGARLVVDTSGEPLKLAAAEGVFMLKPNMNELQDLTDADVSSEAGQEKALRRLIKKGACEVAILSLGAAGVIMTTADTQERLRAPTVSIASRVGAGDSMVAGILVGLGRKYDIRRAVMLGIAAGSAAVMTEGTRLCCRDDVERLFEQME